MASVSNQIKLFSEEMLVNDFTIYTVYMGTQYESDCVKSIMIDNSIVIKNALDSENSNSFYAPCDIEPNSFKSILTFLHTPEHATYDVDMRDEKNIQHTLEICNWFGMTNLYAELIKRYKSLLKKSEPLLKIFPYVNDKLEEFVGLRQQQTSFVVPSDNKYNPIYGLITGDKLNDIELIECCLSLLDFRVPFILSMPFAYTFKFNNDLCLFLKKHCDRDIIREKIDLILNDRKRLYEVYQRTEFPISNKFDWYRLSNHSMCYDSDCDFC
jgi:hypothetical protein